MHLAYVPSASPRAATFGHAGKQRTRSFHVCKALGTSSKKKVGFRYDGANLRWVRDDRFADIAQDPDIVTIKPKSGAAYVAWPAVHTELSNQGLKGVTPAEAQKLASKGWTLVDVRLADDFEQSHVKGAINLPLYRYVEGDTVWDNLKRLAMAGFAMKATERNPNYIQDCLKVVKKNQKLIVMCAIGGTLDTIVSYRREKKLFPDPDRAFGRESRSLKAAYEFLVQGGWSVNNLMFLEGGVQQWRHQGLPMDEDEDDS